MNTESKFFSAGNFTYFLAKLKERAVFGQGLSDVNFTAELKQKLDSLQNSSVDDATVQAVQQKVSELEALIAADTDGVINKFNEIVTFLAGIEDTSTLNGIVSGKVDKVAGKGLSSNDFTDDDKAKLDGIVALTDAELDEILNEALTE